MAKSASSPRRYPSVFPRPAARLLARLPQDFSAAILPVMKTARKLLHTRYRVNDLAKTTKFYQEVLGLEEVRRHKSPRGSELDFLKAPESEGLVEVCYYHSIGPGQLTS